MHSLPDERIIGIATIRLRLVRRVAGGQIMRCSIGALLNRRSWIAPVFDLE
ncbi:hypothetical protein [Lysobacter sp. A289]